MCGIAGIVSEYGREEEALRPSLNALRARGPDQSMIRRFALARNGHSAALLHTRLSIRDLSERGCQPMANEEETIWIVYNGEIYGWETEARELRARGHRFQSDTDTEFIVHGYEEWGEAVLERMRGMFAFALLDLRKKMLFCARDRLGKKPFFYTQGAHGFGFASTLRALTLLYPAGTFAMNPAAIDAFLAHRYIPAPRTLFKGVYKLPPATKLTVGLEGNAEPRIVEYWRPRAIASRADELWPLFQESVQLRLASDRPIGLFLSSGIDSQCVGKALVALGQSKTVKAYTAAFPDSPLTNEGPAAAEFARSIGLAHESLNMRLSSEDALCAIPSLDEPFADPSALPTWALCREATRHAKVALSGDGGDELFAGYKRYDAHLRSRVWNALRGGTQRMQGAAEKFSTKKTLSGKLQRIAQERRLSWEDGYVLRFSGIDPQTRAFLQPALGQFPAHYWRLPAPQPGPLEWMLECDRLNYLPEYILKKGDVCGMAHGLELRSPLLDHEFFQHVLGVPKHERFTKPAKGIMRGWLGLRPDSKRPKMGFNPPLKVWFASAEWQEEIAALPQALSNATGGQLEQSRTARLIGAYADGELPEETIWQMIVLRRSIQWLRSPG